MSRRGQKKKFKYTIHTKYSSFLTYMQLQTIVTLTYYYYIHPTLRKLRPNIRIQQFHTYILFALLFLLLLPPLLMYYYIYILLCCKKNTNSKPKDMFFD